MTAGQEVEAETGVKSGGDQETPPTPAVPKRCLGMWVKKGMSTWGDQ